ncbi:MAG: vitamin K epoxide reductase [Acidobacteria bacterium]|nr:MAG: vitamin K epoxide reductase [Acidobacteriota bacterium]PYY22781.1 MAG: vitamin K epoxide reductase [Acidobacteriota bacterium]
MTSAIKATLTAVIVVLCLAGVIVSGLALGEHYNTRPSPCSINDKWDCGIVNHSPYATLGGVPVALVGSVGYALLAAFAGRLPRTTALMALIGLLFSLRLTWIEWKKLGVWCIYCVTSQGIIATLFVVAILSAVLARRRARSD